ncbi:MAG: tRNA (cytidine(34)-2'-O)-methyltransferase [Planctomycetota bacterium]
MPYLPSVLHVVQYHPAIPQNTGNIARTTVGFGAQLHLIHPMTFEITDHAVKRAGLDYWPSVQLTEHESDDAFLSWLAKHQKTSKAAVWLVTKFGDLRFNRATYGPNDVLIFGNENTGLPDDWHERFKPERQRNSCGGRIEIPMPGPANGDPNIRSFNVANTVAIVLATATAQHLA